MRIPTRRRLPGSRCMAAAGQLHRFGSQLGDLPAGLAVELGCKVGERARVAAVGRDVGRDVDPLAGAATVDPGPLVSPDAEHLDRDRRHRAAVILCRGAERAGRHRRHLGRQGDAQQVGERLAMRGHEGIQGRPEPGCAWAAGRPRRRWPCRRKRLSGTTPSPSPGTCGPPDGTCPGSATEGIAGRVGSGPALGLHSLVRQIAGFRQAAILS